MTAEDRLTTPPHLNGRHRHTYEAIFRHLAAHNLEWHDVRSLARRPGGRGRGNQRCPVGDA